MITLTEQMIRDFGLTGAMAGEIATPEDMAIMGMGKVSPITSTTPDIRPKIRPDLSTSSTVPNVPEPVTPKAAPAPAAFTDPYSNLSDLQRRMLRFAAIKDAGMALQGKEGNAVASVMGDITARADMARKAAAATAATEAQRQQQAAFLGMLGMGGSSTGAGDLDAKRQAIIMGMVTGTIEPQIGDAMLKEIDRQSEVAKEKEGEIKVKEAKISQTKDVLATAKDALLAATGLGEEEFDALAMEEGATVDAKGFYGNRLFLPETLETNDFKNFKANASKLTSIMTLQNLSDVIAAGARLGILSDSDIRLLGNMTGVIDPDTMPQQTADNIFGLYQKLTKTLQVLESGNSSTYLDEKLKQYDILK
jgi:hypothetical protein